MRCLNLCTTALAPERDDGLRRRYIGSTSAKSSDFARASAPLERSDIVAGDRATFLELARNFLRFVHDFVVQRSDRKLADAALLVRSQPIGNPLFERGVWLIRAAQVGEDAAEANFLEIRPSARLPNFIAQLRMEQRQRDKADLGRRAGVAAARR